MHGQEAPGELRERGAGRAQPRERALTPSTARARPPRGKCGTAHGTCRGSGSRGSARRRSAPAPAAASSSGPAGRSLRAAGRNSAVRPRPAPRRPAPSRGPALTELGHDGGQAAVDEGLPAQRGHGMAGRGRGGGRQWQHGKLRSRCYSARAGRGFAAGSGRQEPTALPCYVRRAGPDLERAAAGSRAAPSPPAGPASPSAQDGSEMRLKVVP